MLYVVALLLGILMVQWFAVLPKLIHILLVCVFFIGMAGLAHRLRIKSACCLCIFAACVALGVGYSSWRAQERLIDNLAQIHENKVSKIKILVDSLPTQTTEFIRFTGKVLESNPPDGISRSLQVFWPLTKTRGIYYPPQSLGNPEQIKVVPGQIWQMSVKLRRIHSRQNIYQDDFDAQMFAHNIRAHAVVMDGAKILSFEPCFSVSSCVSYARYVLRAKMQYVLEGLRYANVLVALVVGDQAGVGQDDWQVFNSSGITHLISISGTHITMLAWLGTLAALWRSRKTQSHGKLVSDKRHILPYALFCGALCAFVYCVLAGWGVPAQRTFMMLALALLAHWRLPLMPMWATLVFSALIILLLDPWAVLSKGFYLSFFAIAILWGMAQKGWHDSKIKLALTTQLLMWVALAPFMILLFRQFSLISPLANALAIPLVGLLVTPLSLLTGLLAFLGFDSLAQLCGQLSNWLFSLVMNWINWLNQWSWASVQLPAPQWWQMGLALLGLVIFLLPRGIPFSRWGLLLLLPLFMRFSTAIEIGQWQLIILDTGQSGASLLRTKNHVVLFDTGLRRSWINDDGQNIITPTLRALGIDTIDVLVVSHSDIDHSGGLASVLANFSVTQSYASFDIHGFLQYESKLMAENMPAFILPLKLAQCDESISFNLDEVEFKFLNSPNPSFSKFKSGNDKSCVLAVSGRFHGVLFTGDIGVEQEQVLVRRYPEWIAQDVVLLPHHGSKNSSSFNFVQTVKPQIAVAQSGYNSRFGHPHAQVVQRWQNIGATVLTTSQHGAVQVNSAQGLEYSTRRGRRYWHE